MKLSMQILLIITNRICVPHSDRLPRQFTSASLSLSRVILIDINTENGFKYHCYADDIPIYCSFMLDNILTNPIFALQTCLMEIQGWISCNKLSLNVLKRELLSALHLLRQKKEERQWDSSL